MSDAFAGVTISAMGIDFLFVAPMMTIGIVLFLVGVGLTLVDTSTSVDPTTDFIIKTTSVYGLMIIGAVVILIMIGFWGFDGLIMTLFALLLYLNEQRKLISSEEMCYP